MGYAGDIDSTSDTAIEARPSRNRRDAGVTVACLLGSCLLGACATTGNVANIDRVGFEFVGGETVARPATGILGDTPDEIRAHQIAVLSLHPAVAKPSWPIVLLPGFGIVADTYLQTPDGREGWAMDFVRDGHPVYVVEPSHTARSGIDSGFYMRKDANGDTPQLFSWGAKSVWPRWGLGPRYGEQFDDSRWRLEDYPRIVAAFTAIETDRIAGAHQIDYQLESNVAGLVALLQRIGPAILVAHSASGVAAYTIAARNPKLLRAVISVEPLGCLLAVNGTTALPTLSIFGDHMEVRPQMPARREECRQLVAATQAAGMPAQLLDLPALGIRGNSHLMMMENNSREIAMRMLNWLDGLPGR